MFSFSVAFDSHKGIGKDDKLPWHIKEELALFKRNTLNKNIIMGRKTFENLPGKLKNRNIYVVTKDHKEYDSDIVVINDFEKFLKENCDSEIEYIICGGASIYKQAYPYLTKGYVSELFDDYATDTSIDFFHYNDFVIVEEEVYDKFVYRKLIRR